MQTISKKGLVLGVAGGLLALTGWSAVLPQLPTDFLLEQPVVLVEAAKVNVEAFPDADRVLVENRVLEWYEPHGTSVTWDDEYTKVLTEKGRRAATTHTMHFNTSYGTTFVHRAEIIKADGQAIDIDVERYTRVMTEPGQMGANIYDPNNKIASLSLPGLEVGDVYHLVVCRVVSKARMPDTWADYTVFEYDQPIVKLDYEIIAPPELPIKHKVLRAPLAGTVEYTEQAQADGKTRHIWRVRNVPRMFPEPDMPPLYTQVQRLIMSTIPDWATVSRWYWDLCEPALNKTTPEMQRKVDELIAGITTRDEKIRAIFKFVSQKIRYMGITTEDTAPGYEPHDVSVTFNNRYGVCRDKAALLVALLRLADIPAYPVLIHATAKMDPDVPLPYFNHAITAVDDPQGGYILMDPTDESTRDLLPAYLTNRSYLVARAEGETLLVSEVYPATKNLVKIESQGTLDETDTLLLTTELTFEGINDNIYRGHFVRLKAEQRRKFFEGLLKARLPGAEVVACELLPADLQDTEATLMARLTTRVPFYPVRGTKVDLLTLPWLGTALGYVNFVLGQTSLEERRYTLDTGITCGVQEQIHLKLGTAMGAPYAVPPATEIARGGVLFAMTHQAAQAALQGSLEYQLQVPEFSPAEYQALRQILEEIEAAGRARPLFAAQATQQADQETLFDMTETTLTDAHTWETRRTWSQRILTYGGKKRGAELKFNFNPAWQEIEVLSATVSNLTGEVHQIAPEEMNLMDAGWAGSAPRYPASKTLVVNLPGVETGSVVTVSTRFAQTNSWGYTTARVFDGFEPQQNVSYTLHFPQQLTPVLQTYHAAALAFQATTNSGMVTWRWHTEQARVLRSEGQLPPAHLYRPTVQVSFIDWQQHARNIQTAAKQAARDNQQARRRARELVKGIRGSRARILAIRDEVLRTIRPAGPSFLDLAPGNFTSPDQTLAEQYGNAADRALLLQEMLRAVGFKAQFLIASRDVTRYPAFAAPSREIPQVAYFDVPVVELQYKGRSYLLNEGDQYDELGASSLDGAWALTPKGALKTLQVDATLHNRIESEWVVDLDAQGTADITVIDWYYGTGAGPFRKLYSEMLPEDKRRHHLDLVSSVAQAVKATGDLQVDVVGYPGKREFSLCANNYAVVEDGRLTLLLPRVGGALFPLSTDQRDNPLFLGVHGESLLRCRIILPPGFDQVQLAPASQKLHLPENLGQVDFQLERVVRADQRVELHITQEIKTEADYIPAEIYPALLESNRRLTHPALRTLVVEEGARTRAP